MSELLKLQPEAIWKHFQDLCNIPRPSKKESKAVEFVIDFAKKHNLEYNSDKVGNVVIRKPASKGKEKSPIVVLQAHLDMVPQKNASTEHDFEKDPIKPYVDGEWVKARGTTLGADNGIGVASILAVLEDKDITSGPIEALFTIDEETGMTGAFNLSPDFIKGKILLNLDSEEDGELVIGCAGGMNTTAVFDYKKEPVTGDVKAYKLSITGLKGGHSGVDIDLNRGNANKLLNRFMWNAEHFFGMRLCSVDGGNVRNAIPREAFATVTVPSKTVKEFENSVSTFLKMYKDELAGVEDSISFTAEAIKTPESWIEKAVADRLMDSLYALPNGVIRFITEMPEVVETSTNLAIVKSNDNQIEVMCLLRSAVETSKIDLGNMIESIFNMAQAKTTHDGAYPGWKPNFSSPLLKTMKDTHHRLRGGEPIVKVIHAGLECGLIGDVYPGMDMISFGPTILHPHSPDEKVNIPTVQNFWVYLKETLSELSKL
jgi:dipeptidase D